MAEPVFFSCALGPGREQLAIRYVEWNPLRAGLTKLPQAYIWSSVASHLAGPGSESTALLDWTYWREQAGAEAWNLLLGTPEDIGDTIELREKTYSGAPFGSEEFVKNLGAHPLLETPMTGLVRRIAAGKVAPACSRPQHPQNAVEHLTPTAPRPPAAILASLRLRYQAAKNRPLGIGQTTGGDWHPNH